MILLIILFALLGAFMPVLLYWTPCLESTYVWFGEWESYYGGMIGAIGSVISVVLTIRYYEKKNTKAIKNSQTIARIDEMMVKVSKRETLYDGLFYHDDNLKEVVSMAEQYNDLQSKLLSYFTNKGISQMLSLHDRARAENATDEEEYARYYQLPPDIVEIGKKIGRLSLYKNYIDLFRGDSDIGRYIDFEKGGSLCMWPGFWLINNERYNETEMIDRYNAFMELIPKLISRLEEKKKALM